MSDRHEKLESFLAQLAHSQPLRRAPASLQARVLAQLAAREAPIPWWRRGFAHWPGVARAGFLIASCGFVWLAVAAVMWAITFVGSRQVASAALGARAFPLPSAPSALLRPTALVTLACAMN